jgi:hypothetical protein
MVEKIKRFDSMFIFPHLKILTSLRVVVGANCGANCGTNCGAYNKVQRTAIPIPIADTLDYLVAV